MIALEGPCPKIASPAAGGIAKPDQWLVQSVACFEPVLVVLQPAICPRPLIAVAPNFFPPSVGSFRYLPLRHMRSPTRTSPRALIERVCALNGSGPRSR